MINHLVLLFTIKEFNNIKLNQKKLLLNDAKKLPEVLIGQNKITKHEI